MKSNKLFQACYTINFIVCMIVMAFIGYSIVININYTAVVDVELNSSTGLAITGTVITSLFAIFDWFCYQLMRSIKIDVPLSDTSINTAENFRNLCLVVSVLLALGIASQIMDSVFEVNSKFFNFRKYFLGYCFVVLIATTLYLGTVYPIIVKRHNIGITDSIDKIGNAD